MAIWELEDFSKHTITVNYTWHKIEGVSFSGMEEGRLMEVLAGDKKIGLLKRKEAIYAFSATCPHAGVALCTGWLDAQGRIVCPEHKYRFDPANGRNTSGEGYKLVTYRVEVRGDELFAAFMETADKIQ